MACFADINVSQASATTYARYWGIFSVRLTANLPRDLQVKTILNWLRFDRIMVMSLWPRFFGPPCRHRHTAGIPVLFRGATWGTALKRRSSALKLNPA